MAVPAPQSPKPSGTSKAETGKGLKEEGKEKQGARGSSPCSWSSQLLLLDEIQMGLKNKLCTVPLSPLRLFARNKKYLGRGNVCFPAQRKSHSSVSVYQGQIYLHPAAPGQRSPQGDRDPAGTVKQGLGEGQDTPHAPFPSIQHPSKGSSSFPPISYSVPQLQVLPESFSSGPGSSWPQGFPHHGTPSLTLPQPR